MSRVTAAAAALACAVLAFGAQVRADTGTAATGHSYTLEARLDPGLRRLEATADITWRNNSRVPVSELFFHLYPNAFADDGTVFMREGGAAIRGGRLERKGSLELERLSLRDGTDLLASAQSELVPGDRTQLRVQLPRAVAPGERIELLARFRVHLPSLVARMGEAAGFFMVAQWFPKLARLEPDGRWASFPYHGLGEFYADFADYALAVEVPSEFAIAAPGRLVETRALEGGLRRERYVLRNALDIAFAAYPNLKRVQLRTGRVQVDVFATPGHLGLARTQAALAAVVIARLSARLGPYPYDRIVIVLPPRAAHAAAGMEYPGLVTSWSTGLATRLNPAAPQLHGLVTAHELAHQWFPMLVATHEVETPVLDEGLSEWIGIELVRERHGRRSPWSLLTGVQVDPFELARAGFIASPQPPSSLLPAHRYSPQELAPAVYLRPALALESIARIWGRARLWSALGRYARAHRFRHPSLPELLGAFDAEYWPGFGGSVLRPALAGHGSDTRLVIRARDSARQLRAERHRTSAVPLPLQVLLADATGARTRLAFGGTESRLLFALPPDLELRGAQLDPHRHDLLDGSAADGMLRLSRSAPRPPLLARALLFAQALLAWLGP